MARAPRRGSRWTHDAAAPDEVSASGEHADRRHAAGDGSLESGVLGPERVLHPESGADRIGQLVDVIVPLRVRDRGDAHVRVRVDDSRRDELAAGVHDDRALGRRRPVALADGRDLAAVQEDVAWLESIARGRHHRRVLDENGRALPRLGGLDGHARARLGRGERVGSGEGARGRSRSGRARALELAARQRRREQGRGQRQPGRAERQGQREETRAQRQPGRPQREPPRALSQSI